MLSTCPGHPVNRCGAPLAAAAEGTPPPEISDEQRAQEEAQRQLMIGDPATGFALLAERAPALLDLERHAREGLTRPEWDVAMRHAAKDVSAESRATFVSTFLLRETHHVVGPKSHGADVLVASRAAEMVAGVYLAQVANVSPPAGRWVL